MCQWPDAFGSEDGYAMAAAGFGEQAAEKGGPTLARVIHDPYPTYSAVAVTTNEVLLASGGASS